MGSLAATLLVLAGCWCRLAAPGGAAPGWVALDGQHSGVLRTCARTDGGPCAPHSNLTLLDAKQHGWWNGSTTGDEICQRLGLPPCSRMIAYDCHKKLSCSRPACTNSTPQPCGGELPPAACTAALRASCTHSQP